MNAYHSALAGARQRWPAVSRFECAHGVAFQHDIALGLPAEMQTADVWYADLPWQQGWHKFAAFAGVDQRTRYQDAMRAVGSAARAAGVPVVMVTGKHAVDLLQPLATASVVLNGGDAVACLWRLEPWRRKRDTVEVLESLAAQHRRVGDFCCGYGRAGRIFAARGRQFVLSDLNAECIGYIAAHAAQWA
jgi:hypothetical protein